MAKPRHGVVRQALAAGAGVLMALVPLLCLAEGRLTGLVGLSTDHVFRGRSQTRGDPAAQAGIGYQHDSGLFGGVWISNVDLNPSARGEFELDYILGYGRDLIRDWSGEIALRQYTYPESRDLIDYDYVEIGAAVRYREWLSLTIAYSPGWTGFLSRGPVRDRQLMAVEAGLQWPMRAGFSAVAGVGRLELSGSGAYVFWNAGLAFQYHKLTLDMSYYDTDGSSRALLGSSALGGKLVGSLIYRF